ncbi:MAG: tetratricopeptide repeat protein [Planctomycetes bacterium]|nr:tetratricopeptide repeat protein [Planctomycetota bacterium]
MRKSLLLLAVSLISVAACSTGDDSDLHYNDVEVKSPDDGFEGDSEFYAANAQEYYGAGDYIRALDQFERQLKLDPTSRPGRLGLSLSTYQIGLDQAARGRLGDAEARFTRAESILRELWNGQLVADTEIADDFNWKACLGLAMTERAIAALERRYIEAIDRRITRNEDPKRRAEMLTEQKRHDERRQHYGREALDKFERLARMKNAAPDALLNLGEMHLVVGNEVSAERAYLDYLDIAKQSVEMWNQKRVAAPDEYKSRNELRAALEVIKRKQDQATEKTVGVLERLAEIKFRKRNYADCIGYLKEALALDPARYQLHVPLAECYEHLENDEKALEHIDLFIRSTPGFTEDTQRAYKLRSRLLQKLGRSDVEGQ